MHLGDRVDLDEVAGALRAAVAGREISSARVRRLYRRLVWIFRADLASFERKRFASLSHEPNKAMNLNSYLGLMGGRYRVARRPAGASSSRSAAAPSTSWCRTPTTCSRSTPTACCCRSTACAWCRSWSGRRTQRSRVAQTPYSAFRGAPTRIERIAGATTDLQHIVHQGLTYYDATFWVGANAILRKRALDR